MTCWAIFSRTKHGAMPGNQFGSARTGLGWMKVRRMGLRDVAAGRDCGAGLRDVTAGRDYVDGTTWTGLRGRDYVDGTTGRDYGTGL